MRELEVNELKREDRSDAREVYCDMMGESQNSVTRVGGHCWATAW
jgi:hypothetical protein